MKLGWLSDIHLNFLDESQRFEFLESLTGHGVDGWLISGDIGEAHSVVDLLTEFEGGVRSPTYFVLGNHDFYQGSIRPVTDDVSSLVERSEHLVWLTSSPAVRLREGVGLVGDDGWADGRLGDPLGTQVMLNDFLLIGDLRGVEREELLSRLNRLGDAAAARLSPKLEDAARRNVAVIVVTHAPPYRGATWHEGEISPPDWLPWMTCDAVGREIDRCAARHPTTRFTVLCGHTHSAGRCSPRPNVVVHTAASWYGSPELSAFVRLDRSGVRLRANPGGDGRRDVEGPDSSPPGFPGLLSFVNKKY